MKIVKLTSENVKRLKAVCIKPDGAIVQISGRNAQGKTSVLDSIEMVLGGADHICRKPIRNGHDKAKIVCELDGGLIVKRTFTASGGGSLIVENKDEDRARLYAKRTEVNRDHARMQAMVISMPLHAGLPTAEISVSDLAQELNRRLDHNQKIESAATELQHAADAIDRANLARNQIGESKARAVTDREQQLADADQELDAEIKRLRDRHELKKQRIVAACKSAIATADQLSDQLSKEMAAAEKSLALLKSAASAQLADVASIRSDIAAAEQKNRQIRENQRRAESAKQADAAKQNSDQLTAAIDKIDSDKSDALASAKFPVDGLSFDESGVVFNGVPFDQTSSAEQLKVSAAICFAMNPTLRVLLIRDGSLLDSDGLKTLADIAEERDAQIWIETVSDGSKVGIVIEDGCVVGQEAEETAVA